MCHLCCPVFPGPASSASPGPAPRCSTTRLLPTSALCSQSPDLPGFRVNHSHAGKALGPQLLPSAPWWLPPASRPGPQSPLIFQTSGPSTHSPLGLEGPPSLTPWTLSWGLRSESRCSGRPHPGTQAGLRHLPPALSSGRAQAGPSVSEPTAPQA